jgi:hypothetical protein
VHGGDLHFATHSDTMVELAGQMVGDGLGLAVCRRCWWAILRLSPERATGKCPPCGDDSGAANP